jgi:HEAT repeat protein
MDKEEKLRMLQSLSEEELTNRFLIPLYESPGMSCKSVRYTHRRLEFGKDVIYRKEDEYGDRKYTGIQAKKTKITTKNIDGLLRQTREAFGKPFTDLSDGKEKYLDRFVVLTSNDFLEEANESFRACLRGTNLEKLVTCIDGNQLIRLLDKHFPSAFWDEYDLFNKYFNAMQRDFTTIKDISAIGQREAVSLEQIYVSMRVSEEVEVRELPPEQEWKIFDEKRAERRDQKASLQRERTKVVDSDRAVTDYKRLVIIGNPGSGKTTLLKHLALKWCRENLEKKERLLIPIPIVLRQLADSNTGIREYIDAVFEKYEFPNVKKWIEKDLKAGKCRLLLDGFDELASKESQKKVAEEIERFIKKYKKVPVLVTSRIAGYHDELRGFTKAELLEFDDEQIGKFTENWFGKKDPERASSVLAAITGNEQIKALARNPLMIAIIAIIYEEDRKLPERRADLYQRCVEVLLSKWDVQKRLKNKFGADKKEFILRKLAFYGHTNNKRIITQEEVGTQILEHFPRLGLEEKDLAPFLEEIWQRSFLLRQISMDSYDFLHLSFQEYFTALELTKRDDATDIILDHLDEPWWEEPILLYVGISKDASALIRTIREKVPEDIFHSNLMLCGKCIADADFTDPALKEQISCELYELYKTGMFELLNNSAIEVLGRIKPDKIINDLISDLTTDDSSVRGSAADSLGRIGSEKAIKPLLKALNDESYVGWRATYALGRIGSEKAIEPLLKALNDENGFVRRRTTYALGRIGSEKAIEPLLKALNDENGFVRGSAAEALGSIGSEKAIKPLIKVLTDENGYVRGSAAEALGRIGSVEAIEPLLKALTDERRYVRGSAAYAIGRIGSEEVIELLLKALNDERSDVRRSAAEALGRIGSEEVIEPLLKALNDERSDVRGSAAEALGKIGSEKAIKLLLKALTDEESNVRGRAAYALGRIGSEKAIKPLLKALTDEESDVRGSAAAALGSIGSEKAIKPLLKALTDEESNVRRNIVSALGRIGSEKAIEPLLKALTDKDSNVRDRAFASLMEICRKSRRRIIAPSA